MADEREEYESTANILNQAGDIIIELGSRGYREGDEGEVLLARSNNSRDGLTQMISETADEDTRLGLEQFLRMLYQGESGFGYRQQNRLDGLGDQLYQAESAFGRDWNEFARLTQLLEQQSDAGDIVHRLRQQYASIEDIMDQGGEVNIPRLEKRIWHAIEGADSSATTAMLDQRYRELDALEKVLQGTEKLYSIRKMQDRYEENVSTIRDAKVSLEAQYALGLDSAVVGIVGRSRLDSVDKDGEYKRILDKYQREKNIPQLMMHTLWWTCYNLDLNLDQIMAKGMDAGALTVELSVIEKRWNALSEGVRNRREDEDPHIYYAEMDKLQNRKQTLVNLLSIADNVNRVRELYLQLK